MELSPLTDDATYATCTHRFLPVTYAITDRTRCTWSTTTTVLTDRTEEVAQSAVHLRQIGCTMLKRRTTQSRAYHQGRPPSHPFTPSSYQQKKKKTTPSTISTIHTNDITNDHQKYEHQPTLVAPHLFQGHTSRQPTVLELEPPLDYRKQHLSKSQRVVHRQRSRRH